MTILHRTRVLSALTPRYVERFRCLGSSCEDTCCAGWSIHIDKKTYKAYRQNTAPELSKVLSRSLVRADNPADNSRYATIRTEGPDKACPLMQDGLCAIHKQLGESYISDLCFTYPRLTRQFAGQVEQALSLSCPEAARLALLAEDALDFVESSVTMRDSAITNWDAQQGLPVELMSEIRIFCVNLMRTRELPLWQRLSALGMFCAALSRLTAAGQRDAIPALIDDVVRVIENGELPASLNNVEPNHAAQAMVFATLWANQGFDAPSRYQQDIVDRISAGLGANAYGQTSGKDLVTAYMAGLARLDGVLEEAPYLLENYLANELFLRMFPFETPDAYEGYLRLVSRFCLLRLLLAAHCNAVEQPSLATLIATVHLHGRRFQHDFTYTKRVNQALQDSGWADLDKLYGLIRA